MLFVYQRIYMMEFMINTMEYILHSPHSMNPTMTKILEEEEEKYKKKNVAASFNNINIHFFI